MGATAAWRQGCGGSSLLTAVAVVAAVAEEGLWHGVVVVATAAA